MKTLGRRAFLAALPAAILGTAGWLAVRPAATPGGGARGLLAQLRAAYRRRDARAYGALLTRDCRRTWTLGSRTFWGGTAAELRGVERALGAPGTREIELRFGGEPRVSPGDAPDTWVVENLEYQTRMSTSGGGGSEGRRLTCRGVAQLKLREREEAGVVFHELVHLHTAS